MGARVRLSGVPLGDLLIAAAALAAALAFARGLARVRAQGPTPDGGWDRAALFAAAVLAAGAGLLLLAGPAEERASAHMLQHVLVGDAAPALGLAAMRGQLFAVVVPAAVRRLAARRAVRALLRPGPSLVVWASLLWIWHVPAVYDGALAHEQLHVAEHGSFLLGGLLLWNQLVDPARRGALSLWGSLACALTAMLIAQLLVGMLVLSYRPLYAYGSAADQSLAGLVMAVSQLATLGTFAFLRLRARFREPLALAGGHPLGS